MAKDKENKKSLKTRIAEFFSNIWSKILNWYRTSKFGAIMQKISWFIGYAFWPMAWIKARTFDRLRFDIQKKVVSIIFLLPVMLGFVVFFAYPLITSLIYSFSTVRLSPEGVEILFNTFFSDADFSSKIFDNPLTDASILYNYSYALTIDAEFPVELLNTLGNTAADCAVITIFSLLIAVMLNGNFKGRAAARAIFFLPVIFNSEAVSAALVNSPLTNPNEDALTALFDMGQFMQGIGIPKFLITFLTGITDGIYDTISYSGIQILIFLTAIQSVPKHLYEAAKIEGATQYEMFWKITLPMVSAMIPTVVVYTVVDSYLRSSVNTVIATYANDSNYGVHAAMSWIYLGVVAAFLLVVLGILSKVVFYYDDKK
jgi:ABC-type sugar transport system permease subunit